MSSTVASRAFVTEGRAVSAFSLRSRRGRWCCIVLAGLYCVALGGCAQQVVAQAPTASRPVTKASYVRTARPKQAPSIEQALLQPQPEPDCTFRGPISTPMTAEETRMKLDYESQCYRQAEAIVRTRLRELQTAVEGVIQPTRRRKQARAHH